MALVAVVKRDSDRAGELPETKVVPVGLPQDLHGEAYFDAMSIGGGPGIAFLGVASLVDVDEENLYTAGLSASAERASSKPSLFRRMLSRRPVDDIPLRMVSPSDEDLLLEAAARLEADGGMPGDTPEERITASLELLELLIVHGSTRAKGPFRHHVRRLFEFLQDSELSEAQAERLARLGEMVEA